LTIRDVFHDGLMNIVEADYNKASSSSGRGPEAH